MNEAEIKQGKLNELRNECIEALCGALTKEQRVVFGEGPANARIMLIGEAPGEQETRQGRVFVGQAGKNLNRFLEVLKISRDEIYITNVVKFRPYKCNEKTGRLSNRPPNRKEIALCAPFLNREIGIVDPDLLIALGNVPLQFLLGQDVRVSECHGRFLEYTLKASEGGLCERDGYTGGKKYPLFCLYHPASIIYRRELESVYNEDLKILNDGWERLRNMR